MIITSPSVRNVGILGGGQLARMLALAAYPLGLSVSVLQRKPEHNGMAWRAMLGDWDDPEVLKEFARDVDVVTLENEFVDADALASLEADGHRLYPSSECIRLVQDKLTQKSTLRSADLPVPEFRAVYSHEEVVKAGLDWGWPVVLKKRRNGYDGKGNATISREGEVAASWTALGGDHTPLMVERFCPFVRELAIMVTRSPGGDCMTYPVVETIQRDHICHEVLAPAPGDSAIHARVDEIGRAAVEAIGGVGSIGIECFELADGRILINEMAPRVHNSGHYSIEACECSQFENHLRAIAGLPLGSPRMRRPAAVMVNLLGQGDGIGSPTGIRDALEHPGVHVHCYGKDRSVRGRKMGHVTVLGEDLASARATAENAAAAIQFGSRTAG